jgi:hypothetical protein
MSLYIQIENGQPIGHPYHEENILDVHGEVPSNYQPFMHKEKPDIEFGVYQKQQKTYGLSPDGVTWTEIFTAVDMTPEEKEEEVKFLNKLILLRIRFYLDQSNIIISELTDENQIALWNTYKDKVNAIVMTDDPVNIIVPLMPKKIDGVFVPNVDDNNVWKTKPYPWY